MNAYSEFKKGVAQVAINLVLRWVLFWLRIIIPIVVFGYFYYSITMHWHFVFFAWVLQVVWVVILLKVIGWITGFRLYSKMWMEEGLDRSQYYENRNIPEWVVNGVLSFVVLAVAVTFVLSTGLLGDAYAAWSDYPLPTKDPIAGFWHFFMIYF